MNHRRYIWTVYGVVPFNHTGYYCHVSGDKDAAPTSTHHVLRILWRKISYKSLKSAKNRRGKSRGGKICGFNYSRVEKCLMVRTI